MSTSKVSGFNFTSLTQVRHESGFSSVFGLPTRASVVFAAEASQKRNVV